MTPLSILNQQQKYSIKINTDFFIFFRSILHAILRCQYQKFFYINKVRENTTYAKAISSSASPSQSIDSLNLVCLFRPFIFSGRIRVKEITSDKRVELDWARVDIGRFVLEA